MGGCVGKDQIEAGRRRLSVSKSDIAAIDNDADRGNVKNLRKENLLELFPDASRRASLVGSQSSSTQKGFDNKVTRQMGDELGLVSPFKIGYACKKGLKPESPNQDDFFIFIIDDWGLFGVFDGHGPYGHDISNFVHDQLPSCFIRDPNFLTDPKKAFVSSFAKVQTLVTRASSKGRFDASLSGTTGTSLIITGDKIICAHVGDSRCVLATGEKGGTNFRATDLTKDHKPSDEFEKKRIHNSGGHVRRLEGDVNHRVFLKGKLYPGLAMSRSLGDLVGASAGVSAEPDTIERIIDHSQDRFVIVASDGVWEFISSQEAVELIGQYGPDQVQTAAEILCQEAWKRWIDEEENIVDDITCICMWIKE